MSTMEFAPTEKCRDETPNHYPPCSPYGTFRKVWHPQCRSVKRRPIANDDLGWRPRNAAQRLRCVGRLGPRRKRPPSRRRRTDFSSEPNGCDLRSRNNVGSCRSVVGFVRKFLSSNIGSRLTQSRGMGKSQATWESSLGDRLSNQLQPSRVGLARPLRAGMGGGANGGKQRRIEPRQPLNRCSSDLV
jgi:hypothetical protein